MLLTKSFKLSRFIISQAKRTKEKLDKKKFVELFCLLAYPNVICTFAYTKNRIL